MYYHRPWYLAPRQHSKLDSNNHRSRWGNFLRKGILINLFSLQVTVRSENSPRTHVSFCAVKSVVKNASTVIVNILNGVVTINLPIVQAASSRLHSLKQFRSSSPQFKMQLTKISWHFSLQIRFKSETLNYFVFDQARSESENESLAF